MAWQLLFPSMKTIKKEIQFINNYNNKNYTFVYYIESEQGTKISSHYENVGLKLFFYKIRLSIINL